MSILDIGARDGYISRLLTSKFQQVVALDLTEPQISDPAVITTAGDATALDFPDEHFDCVICAEVLEHIPSPSLERACAEIARVARRHVVIGVPYAQDTRLGRTTCRSCGAKNPPWGHVNRFDEMRLQQLFAQLALEQFSYVGETADRTNFLSTLLMDLAGNPYGTYEQDETCISCGRELQPPVERTLLQRVFTRSALELQKLQSSFASPRPKWLHALFSKCSVETAPSDASVGTPSRPGNG